MSEEQEEVVRPSLDDEMLNLAWKGYNQLLAEFEEDKKKAEAMHYGPLYVGVRAEVAKRKQWLDAISAQLVERRKAVQKAERAKAEEEYRQRQVDEARRILDDIEQGTR